MVERGKHHHIAVVYRGKMDNELAERIRQTSKEIDERYGKILESWDGSVNEVRGDQ